MSNWQCAALWVHLLLNKSSHFNREGLRGIGCNRLCGIKMPHDLDMLRFHDKWVTRLALLQRGMDYMGNSNRDVNPYEQFAIRVEYYK